jgi:LysM repeat protein
MLFRLWCAVTPLLVCIGLGGCTPPAESQSDEQKNPYFLAGKERAAARDFKGAIEAFEKALEVNPRSVPAHFELGVLYEQHGEHNQDDYVSAMYHYNRVVKLRPNEYPADNARQRLAGCKQELVKSESLAPVYQAVQRDLEKLREENQLLRRQLETAQVSARTSVPSSPSAQPGIVVATRTSLPGGSNASSNSSRPQPSPPRDRVTPLPAPAATMRTHTVKEGDTPYSLSRQYRIKLDALMSANPGLDPKRLRIGQTLNIPSS